MEKSELHFMDIVSFMKRDTWWEYTETDKVWSFAFQINSRKSLITKAVYSHQEVKFYVGEVRKLLNLIIGR
jgi:hypothetical protein